MVRRVLLLGLLLLLSAALSLAADLNGRWEGSMSTPNGDFSLVFNFKVQGAALTGTVETPNGSVDITDTNSRAAFSKAAIAVYTTAISCADATMARKAGPVKSVLRPFGWGRRRHQSC